MSDPSAERTRTVTWQDPMVAAQAARSMSGLEFLQAISRGEVPPPPIMVLLNISAVDVEAGRVVFAVEPAEYHYNPIGVVHGGLACTICDSAMGCAVQTMLPAGVGYTTLELKVNLVKALTAATGLVRCEGTTIHVGRQVATAEARLTDAKGTLYAHATTTCLVMQPR